MLSTLDLAHVRARDPSQACQLFLTDSLFQACGTHRFSEGQRWLGFKCGITQFLLYTPSRMKNLHFAGKGQHIKFIILIHNDSLSYGTALVVFAAFQPGNLALFFIEEAQYLLA